MKFIILVFSYVLFTLTSSKNLHFNIEMMKVHHHHKSFLLSSSSLHEYESNDLITVHMIPHSHDDLGWTKTVNDYYWGSKKFVDSEQVQYILDTVVSALDADPSKAFVYVEIFYFKNGGINNLKTQRK